MSQYHSAGLSQYLQDHCQRWSENESHKVDMSFYIACRSFAALGCDQPQVESLIPFFILLSWCPLPDADIPRSESDRSKSGNTKSEWFTPGKTPSVQSAFIAPINHQNDCGVLDGEVWMPQPRCANCPLRATRLGEVAQFQNKNVCRQCISGFYAVITMQCCSAT
jgi:hypothetical protein